MVGHRCQLAHLNVPFRAIFYPIFSSHLLHLCHHPSSSPVPLLASSVRITKNGAPPLVPIHHHLQPVHRPTPRPPPLLLPTAVKAQTLALSRRRLVASPAGCWPGACPCRGRERGGKVVPLSPLFGELICWSCMALWGCMTSDVPAACINIVHVNDPFTIHKILR